MAAETGLLVLGEVLLAGATATGVVALAPGRDASRGPWARASRWLAIAAAVPVTLASLLLLFYFLVPDLSVQYVWSNTSRLYPWWYRLAGFWGGQDGSLLLWAWLGVGLLAAAETTPKETGSRVWPVARIVVLLVNVVLLLVAVDLGPFQPTPQAFLVNSPDGAGISPLLLSPFMLIHPPIQFLGYALAAFPAGYAAAYLVTDDDGWVDGALAWTRRQWLFLTAAVGLGGLWAYYVLSFGGYWAWDPVETANLLPWIMLTLGIHALIFHRRRGQYPHLAPLALLLTYTLVWFATFVTRTGLWISVHSFVVESSTIQDPLLRFAAVLSRSSLAADTLRVILVSLLGTGALFVVRFARQSRALIVRAFHLGYAGFLVVIGGVALLDPVAFVRFGLAIGERVWPAEPGLATGLLAGALIGLPPLVRTMTQDGEEVIEVEDVADLVTDRNLATIAILLLFTALSTTLLLLLLGINGIQPAVYDSRAPLVALPIAVALSVLFLHQRIGARRALFAGLGSAAAGAGMSLLTDPPLLGLGLPILLLAAGSGYAKLLEVLGVPGVPRGRKELSGSLLLLSGLLAVGMWASPPSVLDLGVAVLEPGLLASIAGLALGVATLVGAVVVLRDGPGAARWAPLAGVVALGWYVGAVLAVAAWLLGRGVGSRDLDATAHLKRAGTWMIHLGVVVLMIGYGTSTFFQAQHEWDQTDAVARGVPVSWDDYTFTFVGAEGGSTLGQGFHDRMWTTVRIEEDGQLRDTGRMLLYWGDATQNYVPQVYISRGLLTDVYLVPDGVHTEEEGWVMANGQPTRLETDDVDRVAMRAIVFPGVNLLWTGYVLMLVGIGLVIVPRRRSATGNLFNLDGVT